MTRCSFAFDDSAGAWLCGCGASVALPKDFTLPIVAYAEHGDDYMPGLGDYTESLLASIGVTQDRYVAAKQLFGLPPTCGCDARKEWLNRVSDWWRGGPQ